MSNQDYPQQAPYPQQEPYPQQAPYPQQPYPQQEPYPQQAQYPPEKDPGYPPAYSQPQAGQSANQAPPYQPGAYPQGQAPPYSQQQQQQTVIVQPPTSSSVRVDRPRNQPELGIGAIIFASIATFVLLSMGCIWTLPCTIVGIVLGITSAAAGSEGNLSSAKTQAGVSIGCTSFGIFSAVAGVVILIAAIFSVFFRNV